MLIIKEVRIKNIGRFVTEQTIHFDKLGNLIQVDGENHNTGGSSGSGKTTIFNAVDYLLGLNDLPVTVLQARSTKEGILVVGSFDWDGKDVLLIRGKGKLSITIDGETTEGSNKLVEEKIDAMLGMARDLFRPIFHKRQKEGGFFLKMGPSDKSGFLTDILGMQEYARKVTVIDTKIKAIEAVKKTAESAHPAARAGLSASQDSILALGLAPVRDMHQEVVLKLKDTSDKAAAAVTELQLRHALELSTIEATRPVATQAEILQQPTLTVSPYDETKLNAIIAEATLAAEKVEELKSLERTRNGRLTMDIRERKLSLPLLQKAVSDAAKAKIEATSVAEEIKQLRACICPTCQQSWIAEAAKVKEADLLAKIGTLKTAFLEGASAEVAIAATQQTITALELEAVTPLDLYETADLMKRRDDLRLEEMNERHSMREHADAQANRNKDLMAEHAVKQQALYAQNETLNIQTNEAFNVKVSAIRSQHTLELEQALGQANLDYNAFQIAANKLRSYEESRQRYETSFNSLKANEATYLAKVETEARTLDASIAEMSVAEEVKRAIKSFMSVSFEDALAEIGDGATRIIRSVPNMVNATIQFQGLKEAKNGAVREEVNAVLSMDGEEGVDIRSLSGGEGSAADLAIDLAVIELIENRSNKGINVFILDEPFNGLGATEIEPTLELLKSLKTNKNIIIVDHNEAVKEMVSDRIVAVRNGVHSTISTKQ